MKISHRIATACACGSMAAIMLTGCASNAAKTAENIQKKLDFYSSINAAKDISDYKYDIDIDANIAADENTALFGLNLDGIMLNTDNIETTEMTMNLGFDFSVSGSTDIRDLTVTDIIVKDKVIYINANKLMTALTKIAQESDAAMSVDDMKTAFDSLGITTDYIKIDIDEISKSLPTDSDDAANTIDMNNLTAESEAFINSLKSHLETAFGSLKTQLIGESDGQYTFALTNANTTAICDALVSFFNNDISSIYDEFIKAAEASGAAAEYIEQIKASKPDAEAINDIISQINNIKDNADSLPDFAINGWTTFAGSEENHDRSFNGRFKATVSPAKTDDQTNNTSDSDVMDPAFGYPSNMTMDINCVIAISEVTESTTISIPTGETTSFTDIMSNMNNMSSTGIDESYTPYALPSDNQNDYEFDTDYTDMFGDDTF